MNTRIDPSAIWKKFFRILTRFSVLAALWVTTAAWANPDYPQYGYTHALRNESYNWVSAYEEGSSHTDYYTSTEGGSMAITGGIDSSYSGTLSGNRSSAQGGQAITGFVNQYMLLVDDNYTLPASSETINVAGYPAAFAGGSYSITYYDGGNYNYGSSSSSYSGGHSSSSSSSTWDTGNWMNNSSTYSESYSSGPNGGSTTLFGRTLAHTDTSGSSTTTTYPGGWTNSSGSNNTSYSDGGSNISYYYSYDSTFIWSGYSGYDPLFGSFNHSDQWPDGGMTRSSSTFPYNLWINGNLATWYSGSFDLSGGVSDLYNGGTYQLYFNLLDFVTNGSTSITVYYNGGSYSGTVSGTQEHPVFSVSGLDIQTADPVTLVPFFTANKLYVNGTPYSFDTGYQDLNGNRTDMYSNPSAGTLSISGYTWDANSGTVTVSYNGGAFYGSYTGGGNFSVEGLTILTTPLSGIPPVFWVRGAFYARDGDTNNYLANNSAAAFTFSGAGTSYTIAGSDAIGAFTGSYDTNAGGGVFMLTQNSAPIPAVPANSDGTLLLSGTAPPQDFPPAVKINGYDVWAYLGTQTEDTSPGAQAAYYGNAATAADASINHAVLKIRTDGSGTVTFTDYNDANATGTGAYSTVTHLFQTGTTAGLPMPTIGVDPSANNAAWGLLTAPNGLPGSFVLNGEAWRYAGTDEDGNAHYIGYISGQDMSVSPPNADGQRQITVTDPVHGNTTGVLNDPRGFSRLDNGIRAYSGNYNGNRVNVPIDDAKFQTIAGDLDVAGNTLSLGSWALDSTVAGVSLTYDDTGDVGTLHSAMNRQVAQWIWYHASSNDLGATLVPMMKLDQNHALNLYDASNGSTPTVVLDPRADAVSQLPKLELTNSPAAGDATNSSVLTKGLGDALYLRSGAAGVFRVAPSGDVPMGDFTNGTQP